MEPLLALPTTFSAGTTLIVERSPADHPPGDGWALRLHLAGASRLDVDGTAVDDEIFRFTIGAEETAGLCAGSYRWVERASLAGAVYDVASGRVEITLDLATADLGDGRPPAERMLELVEARLAGRFESDMESYTIAGRTVSRTPLDVLYRLRNALRAEVAAETSPSGAFSRPVHIRFTRPR